MSLLSDHAAGAYEDRAPGRWNAQCAGCGWFSKRTYTSEERAERSAKRHRTEATEADRLAHLTMFGPKPRSTA